MYAHFFIRSMQNSQSLLIVNRCLSLTSIHRAAATKSKEKPQPNADHVKSSTETKTEANVNAPKQKNEKKPIPPPTAGVNDPNKIYSEKIQQLADEISKLSLVDVMDLNELLKKTLKIQDVPIMGASSSAPATGPVASKNNEDEEGARPMAQSLFKVRLIKIDETKKVPVIKQVKDVMENINLVQAKKLVESMPQILRDNMSKADAETMKAKIEAAGGVCVIE